MRIIFIPSLKIIIFGDTLKQPTFRMSSLLSKNCDQQVDACGLKFQAQQKLFRSKL